MPNGRILELAKLTAQDAEWQGEESQQLAEMALSNYKKNSASYAFGETSGDQAGMFERRKTNGSISTNISSENLKN